MAYKIPVWRYIVLGLNVCRKFVREMRVRNKTKWTKFFFFSPNRTDTRMLKRTAECTHTHTYTHNVGRGYKRYTPCISEIKADIPNETWETSTLLLICYIYIWMNTHSANLISKSPCNHTEPKKKGQHLHVQKRWIVYLRGGGDFS